MSWKLAAAALIAGAVGLLLPPALAQEPSVERLELIQAGFMTARKTGATANAPGTATGFTVEANRMEFLSEPPSQAAKVGTIFGVKFRAVGEPRKAKANLRAVWKIPPPGITNPKTANVYREDVSEFAVIVGDESWRAYGFDEPWEIARGTWTLEIWDRDRKLLEQSFKIE